MMKAVLRPLARAFGGAMARIFRELGAWLSCGLAAAVGAVILFAWLADEVLEGDTRIFDENVRSIIHSHASPVLTSIMRSVTMLGSASVLITIGACAAVIFLAAGWARHVALLAVTMTGAAAINFALKLSFGRTRPTSFFDIPLPVSYSFPSGHALLSLCFYWAIAMIIADHLRHRATQVVIWTMAALLVAMVGFSRIYLGVHYPSDVIAGYAAGTIWFVTTAIADHMLWRRTAKREGKSDVA